MFKPFLNQSIKNYIIILLIFLFLILSYNYFDFETVNNLIEQSQRNVNNKGIYVILLIFLLRSVSIFIPLIPGTYCVVIAGYIYGIKTGISIMFLADFLSCYTSFLISRNLGRGFIKKLLGYKQMQKIETISTKYLENNFFLMTGFLMTSWFDFVAYAVGLTKISWKRFMPALIVSILISDIPFVAAGYTLSQLRGVTLSDILNGDVDVINGPYLLTLIVSALIVFGLGILNIFFNRKANLN